MIDTSVWIASFKKAGDYALKEMVRQATISGLAMSSPVIILELLQGCSTVEERDSLKAKLESLDLLQINLDVWKKAYELGFTVRRKGLTIPTVDFIIAALAIENKTTLLHCDEHFEMIARYNPDLDTKYFGPKQK